MKEQILRIIVCPSKFYSLSNLNCDAVEFEDTYEEYFNYMAEHVLSERYDCACIVEYCTGSQYGVQFRAEVAEGDEMDYGYKLSKLAFEEYSSGKIVLPDFESFVGV